MNTSVGGVGTSAISPPTSIMIYMDGAPLVTIRPTGVIEYGPDYTPDAAAKAFWEALGNSMPADRKLAGELKAELSESARLHAMGSEREARLMARVVELERESLRGLEAGEPTNREKIYGPLLDKIAGEPQVKPTAVSQPKCEARQMSDQMWCHKCCLSWDMNDPSPPSSCGKPTECTRTAPKRIWLQISDEAQNLDEPFPASEEGITWCSDSVADCEVEYVRADLAALRSKVAELHEANVGLAQESHDLQQICRNAYEVWAGSEGIPAPQTAAEAYLLQLLEQMRDEVKRGLK